VLGHGPKPLHILGVDPEFPKLLSNSSSRDLTLGLKAYITCVGTTRCLPYLSHVRRFHFCNSIFHVYFMYIYTSVSPLTWSLCLCACGQSRANGMYMVSESTCFLCLCASDQSCEKLLPFKLGILRWRRICACAWSHVHGFWVEMSPVLGVPDICQWFLSRPESCACVLVPDLVRICFLLNWGFSLEVSFVQLCLCPISWYYSTWFLSQQPCASAKRQVA
jgi:hypothetical protein